MIIECSILEDLRYLFYENPNNGISDLKVYIYVSKG